MLARNPCYDFWTGRELNPLPIASERDHHASLKSVTRMRGIRELMLYILCLC